jgi:heat shock protein HslJ
MIEALVLVVALQVPQLPTPPQSETPPHEGEWTVEVLDNIKVMPDSRVTIRIEGASIRGSGPCNTYQGAWTLGIDQGVKVGPLLKTMKSCDPPRMSEEGDFFALLGEVVAYEVRADTLILRTRNGKTISARRATPTLVP